MWMCMYACVTASVFLCCRNNTKSLPFNNGHKAQGVALAPRLSVWLSGDSTFDKGWRGSQGVWGGHVQAAVFKIITNRDLLFGTGDSAQCSGPAWMGGQSGEAGPMAMCGWAPSHSPKLTSLISYTPIQNREFKRTKKDEFEMKS